MQLFKKIKQITHLMKHIDFKELGEISEKIDLPKIMKSVGELDENQLNGLKKMQHQDTTSETRARRNKVGSVHSHQFREQALRLDWC